jgi:aldehyde dehydrogenase (NAD+)
VTVLQEIDQAARDRVVAVAEDAVNAGGRVLTGGTTRERDGWFVAPTVVEGVPGDHTLACDEVFGPICLLQTAADLDEAVELANAVPHGLAAGVYTRDLGSALSAAQRLEAGLVKVNAPTSGVDFYLPFGGEKASSIGAREQGKAAQEFYTTVHTITVAPA